MIDNKVGTYNFVAEPFHVDFMGRLTMGVLGNHLLNCAGFHASDRGFGIAELNENHYTWVLSRLAIELEDMPHQYETFSIQTWVENVYRLFTDRDFALVNKDGKTIGYARSVWATARFLPQPAQEASRCLRLQAASRSFTPTAHGFITPAIPSPTAAHL